MTQGQKVDCLIVISPPSEIMSVTMDLKRRVSEVTKNNRSLNSTPHITVCKTILTSNREDKIVEEWRKLCLSLSSFRINVDGISVFENSGTIFLKTDYPEELKEIRTRFKLKNNELRVSKKETHLLSTPHITIDKGLKSNTLKELEQAFSGFSFKKEFLVTGLTCLRADTSDVRYKVNEIFKLKEYY